MITYYENGEIRSESWYFNGEEHRENDQPAVIVYDEDGEIKSQSWYFNDQLHRENDQPAVIEHDEEDVESWSEEMVFKRPAASGE